MKSSDSVDYYEYHSKRLAEQDLAARPIGEWSPFALELRPGDCVLDLGCGSGFDLKGMEQAGLKVTGLDAAPSRIQIARTLCPGASFIEKNFLFYTPKEAEWDGVWANRSLHHFTPEVTQRVVASMFRGLKPGGVLGVVVYEGTSAFTDREGDWSGPSRRIHPWSEKGISSMVEQSGFSIKKVGRQSANPSHGHPLPSLLILALKV